MPETNQVPRSTEVEQILRTLITLAREADAAEWEAVMGFLIDWMNDAILSFDQDDIAAIDPEKIELTL